MREIDGLPVYKITIDKEYSENGEDLGVDQIAFTSNPAIQVKGFAFESQEPKKLFFKDEVKMRIAAPSMIPMDIYRKDDDGTEYYVEFTAEVIEEIHSKMMANLKTKDLFNLEHDAEKKVPAYVHEILLVDSEAKQKYIKDEYDIDTKLGSQFVVSQITDKDYYNSLVENEQFAYSIEGFLGLKLNKQNKMENPKFEIDGKFYELIEGVPVLLSETEEKEEEVAMEEAPVKEEKEEEVAAQEEEKEEEKEEEMQEEEEEEKEKMAVDPEADAEAIMAIVAPALDALRAEILEALAEKQNEEEEVVEEEVEMEETQLSITERFGAIARAFKDVNY